LVLRAKPPRETTAFYSGSSVGHERSTTKIAPPEFLALRRYWQAVDPAPQKLTNSPSGRQRHEGLRGWMESTRPRHGLLGPREPTASGQEIGHRRARNDCFWEILRRPSFFLANWLKMGIGKFFFRQIRSRNFRRRG